MKQQIRVLSDKLLEEIIVMPTKIRLTLAGPAMSPPLEYGRCLQGLVYGWLQDIDPTIHDLNQMKPLTISPLWREAETLHSFEVAVLVDGLTGALLERIARGAPRVKLARKSGVELFEIQNVAFSATASWEEIMEAVYTDAPEFAFEMRTPTAHHAPGRLRKTLPLPAPELYFGNWLERWNLCCPHMFPDTLKELAANQMAVSFCEGATRMLRLEDRRSFLGFEGAVRFRLLEPQEVTRDALIALGALARFADFCGTGVDTMRGMGQTRFLRSRQGRS